MRTYLVTLESTSPYSQSRFHNIPKLEKEQGNDYENRTWMERFSYDKDGHIFIQPMAFKKCFDAAAKYNSTRIPGQGKATYTKHFVSGTMVVDVITTKYTKEDIVKESFLVPANGKPGDGTRVVKHFPMIPDWSGTLPIYVLDEIIVPDVLRSFVEEAGKFIGVGRFRPQNGGFYGRFQVKDLQLQ